MTYRPVRLGDLRPVVARDADGATIVCAAQPLDVYPRSMTDRLVHSAGGAAGRTLLAWRDGDTFARLTYAEVLTRVRSAAQALLERGLSAERPLAILSGNDE